MDKTTALVLTAVAGILVGGFVAVTVSGHDAGAYALFLGGPAVSGIVGALLFKRTAQVQADVAEVKTATNGLLSARLDDVTQRLDDASSERQAIAAAIGTPSAGTAAAGPVVPAPRHSTENENGGV